MQGRGHGRALDNIPELEETELESGKTMTLKFKCRILERRMLKNSRDLQRSPFRIHLSTDRHTYVRKLLKAGKARMRVRNIALSQDLLPSVSQTNLQNTWHWVVLCFKTGQLAQYWAMAGSYKANIKTRTRPRRINLFLINCIPVYSSRTFTGIQKYLAPEKVKFKISGCRQVLAGIQKAREI